MADIIQLLPESVANQIAAGEVIQRPSSVVKELLENSIDAGAQNIHLVVKDSGKTLLQVVDDGKGMSDTDARMSFERHATSKIRNADQLFDIKTMGFRGEALASIASIAHVEMITKAAESKLGTRILMQGSKIRKQEYCQANQGTQISVKNLFYNVPARRKFLKTDAVELKHIIEEFKRIALAHPDVSMIFIHNEAELYHLPKSNLRKRIVHFQGKNNNEKLVPIEESTDILSIEGFIGKPEYAKKNKNDQYLFVNKRFVKSNYLSHAIKMAYGELLSKEQYPFYVINLSLDPEGIDINIHPTKTEIKFAEDRLIYQYLKVTAQHALGKYSVVPTLDFQDSTLHKQGNQTGSPSNFQHNIPNKPSKEELDEWNQFYQELPAISEIPDEDRQLILKSKVGENESSEPLESLSKSFQIHQSYIIHPTKSGYLIIHQQFAHERILYEGYLRMFMQSEHSIQRLLFPIQIDLDPVKSQLLSEMLESTQSLGFDITHFGDQSFVIHGVPSMLHNANVEEILLSAIDQYQSNVELKLGIKENVARSFAKCSSLKKGTSLDNHEIYQLVSDLMSCEVPFISPSGRKCFLEIELNELEKQF